MATERDSETSAKLKTSFGLLKILSERYETVKSAKNASETEKQEIWNAVKAHEKLIEAMGGAYKISSSSPNLISLKNHRLYEEVKFCTVEEVDLDTFITSDEFKLCEYRYDVEELKALSEELNVLNKSGENSSIRAPKLAKINDRIKKIEDRYPDFKDKIEQKTPNVVSTLQAVKQEKAAVDTAVNENWSTFRYGNGSGLMARIASLGNFILNKIKSSLTKNDLEASQEKVNALEENDPKAALAEHFRFFKSSYETAESALKVAPGAISPVTTVSKFPH